MSVLPQLTHKLRNPSKTVHIEKEAGNEWEPTPERYNVYYKTTKIKTVQDIFQLG